MSRTPSRAPALHRLCAALLTAGLALPAAAANDLFFSEYIEGSSNNKALEIYNGTGAAVDLAAGGYVVQMYFNGNTTVGTTINLSGSVAPGDVFVLAHASANATILSQADQTSSANFYNGDDAIVLRKGGASGGIVDAIGQVGVDPGTQWGSGDASTADNTLRRKATVSEGDSNAGDAFDPPVQWDGYATDVFDGLGSYAGGSGSGGSGGGTACGGAYTAIPAIQGSGAETPLSGQVVTTEGVVVGDYEGASPNLRGFYLQDAAGDGNSLTSDGLFVFNGNNSSVNLGDKVRVTGTVSEYQGQTQMSSLSAIEPCGTGGVTPVEVYLPLANGDDLERYEGMLVRLPQTLYVTEHYQLGRFGQVLVSNGARLAQPTQVAAPGAAALAVQADNDLNRLLIDDELNNQNPDPIRFGRNGQPLSAANTLRGGDTLSGAVGVLTYTWSGNSASGNAWRLRPGNALNGAASFQAENDRPAAAPALGGNLRAASFNLLNYFNTFSGCAYGVDGAAADCRGAENATEFQRQADKTVAAILGLEADVIGVMELENDGYDGNSAIADLVARLNAAAGAGTYAYINADAASGQLNKLGDDAIKVGLLYQPGRVAPLGTAVLDSGAFGHFTTAGEGVIRRNRPALAQSFRHAGGGKFTVVVNHLKSKGSSCEGNLAPVASDPDAGDGQGNCNLTRSAAAAELAAWLAGDPTGVNDADVLILGDLNSYAQEDPVTTLTGAGYVNLIQAHGGAGTYSYVFDGQWGNLDHALATPSLAAQVAGVAEWHINADEPAVLDYNTNFKSAGQIAGLYAADAYRASDHDPVIVALDLVSDNRAPVAHAGMDRKVRVNSQTTLDGSASHDPDGDALSHAWSQIDGAAVTLSDAAAVKPGFSAASVGPRRFQLQVSDGLAASQAQVTLDVLRLGDVDGDGDVDRDDLTLVQAALNRATGADDPRDVDGNRRIDAVDARRLVNLCTRARCATN